MKRGRNEYRVTLRVAKAITEPDGTSREFQQRAVFYTSADSRDGAIEAAKRGAGTEQGFVAVTAVLNVELADDLRGV
jgi:hypothetical protein